MSRRPIDNSRKSMRIDFIKAHAYGNDFLFIEESAVGADETCGFAQAVCNRHGGIGADGLIFYRCTASGAAMKLYNANGTVAEVSGNGVRCLAAIIVDDLMTDISLSKDVSEIVIETDGGIKTLALLLAEPPRYNFRAFMGEPKDIRQRQLSVQGEQVQVVTLSVGNPQCIVLTDNLKEDHFRFLGPALSTHADFPQGTNVQFVQVERSDRLRILIWERGVGPTTSSGTGACASAVATAFLGMTDRKVEVISPGGGQIVEWLADGLYLTGGAEIIARGEWVVP